MKRIGILRIFAGLAALALLLGPAAPAMQAEFECKQELMAGAWAAHGNLNGQGGMPEGPWSAIGLVVFDELGYATTAIQTNTTSATPNGAAPENFLARFEIIFTVNPDCTAKYTFRNVDPSAPVYGKIIFSLDAVCANGQRECYATFTETPPPDNTDPITLIGVWNLKKLEPDDQRLSQKLQVMDAKINALMRRQGLNPGAFDNAQ